MDECEQECSPSNSEIVYCEVIAKCVLAPAWSESHAVAPLNNTNRVHPIVARDSNETACATVQCPTGSKCIVVNGRGTCEPVRRETADKLCAFFAAKNHSSEPRLGSLCRYLMRARQQMRCRQ